MKRHEQGREALRNKGVIQEVGINIEENRREKRARAIQAMGLVNREGD